jgi:hypothetical protein
MTATNGFQMDMICKAYRKAMVAYRYYGKAYRKENENVQTDHAS